jgi:hypothetical protein
MKKVIYHFSLYKQKHCKAGIFIGHIRIDKGDIVFDFYKNRLYL